MLLSPRVFEKRKSTKTKPIMAEEKKKGATDTKEEPDGNPRPYPSTPRSKDGPKAQIFALLIGINDYQGSVTKLGGCISDVNLTANYLRKTFGKDKVEKTIKSTEAVDTTEMHGRLHLRILTNAKATYANIITAFDEHLVKNAKATGDDTFWFHFSGHGTEQFTAEDFFKPADEEGNRLPSLEPNGKDQSLVCYNPGGTQAGIFLADKELAAMISTLYTTVPSKEDALPHIVVSLDCCHSGSGTRDFTEPTGFKSRNYDFLGNQQRPKSTSLQRGESLTDTRGDGITERSVRTLDSYYNGYYVKQKAKDGALSVPHAQHVLLSACTNSEKAGDLPLGGVFSSSLVGVLSSSPGGETPNYSDLFKQTRALARSKRNAQNPQLEPIAGFNPNTAFLEGWQSGDTQEYEVVPKRKRWYLRGGAVHGLPTSSNIAELPEGSPKEIIVKVFEKKGNEKILLGHALVKKVGVQESRLELMEDLEGKLEMTSAENRKEDDIASAFYIAEIFQLPGLPFYVQLVGTEEETAKLREQWTVEQEQNKNLNRLNILIAQNTAEEQLAQARVEIENGKYLISEKQQDKRWDHPTLDTSKEDEDTIVDQTKTYLEKIARWTRLLALKNEDSPLDNAFAVELFTLDYDQWVEKGEFEIGKAAEFLENAPKHTEFPLVLLNNKEALFNPDNILDTDDLDENAMPSDGVFFAIRLKTFQDNLYFYLYDFDQEAGITYILEELLEKKVDEEGVLLVSTRAYNLDDDESESTLRLKLLVTQQPLEDKQLLAQEGFSGSRGGMGRPVGAATTDGWQAQTIEMKLVRMQDKIREGEEVNLAEGNVTVMSHGGVSADLRITATSQGADRSLGGNPFQTLEGLGISLVNFSKERSTVGKQNVLELNNLEVASPESLQNNPLQIQLNEHLADDEVMVPVTFDGEFLRVIGDAEQMNGKVQVNIRALPDTKRVFDEHGKFIPNPLGEEDVDRSLVKGLKMAFMKWKAGQVTDKDKQEEARKAINKLCWVEYHNDGTVERKEGNVAAKVKVAKNILLTVHGIIGDTEVIAANVPNMISKDGSSLADKYDLVLTYDYENLNTPIADTAKDLQEKLKAVGIDADSGKKITILAHSMGGLVSRHLVEKLDGSAFVKHLVMAGTPNAGSPFGNAPGYLGFATNMLDIAFNFIPSIAPVSGALSKGLKALSDAELFETLAEMKPGSPFLEKLNDPNHQQKGVKYSILAGDVSKYKVSGGRFARFLESTTIAIGNLANKPTKHDIAVGVNDILNAVVWEARGQTVDHKTINCHHLNYFITDVGQGALAEILS